jgi:hypothetical protein
MVIKRINPMSFAKVSGTLYALMGLLIGAMFSLIGLVGGAASNESMGMGFGAIMGVGAIIFFPILYGILGFVFSLIGAWLYNIVAGMVGGIEFEV